MSSTKFKGEIPESKNKKNQSYSIDNTKGKTIEDLVESIRHKIRRIQQSKQPVSRRK